MFLYIWVRGTLPRFRYDQLMGFSWKFLLPLSMANVLDHQPGCGIAFVISQCART